MNVEQYRKAKLELLGRVADAVENIAFHMPPTAHQQVKIDMPEETDTGVNVAEGKPAVEAPKTNGAEAPAPETEGPEPYTMKEATAILSDFIANNEEGEQVLAMTFKAVGVANLSGLSEEQRHEICTKIAGPVEDYRG